MKLLFVNPHPDDVEFACASTCQQAVELGWDVYEILMTSDEYGTTRNDFKGERIRRIRKHEMLEAAKVYGTNQDGSPIIKLIWFGEIDGYLPFNRDVFLRLRKKVLNIKPDVIIGPDSFFSLDLHPDHKHTGWLIYLIVKSIEPSKRPILLLYHSTKTNFYIPIKDITIQVKAWAKHRSQTTPLSTKILLPLRKFFYTCKRIKSGPIIAESFRKVDFSEDENKIITLRHKLLYYLNAKAFSNFGGGSKGERFRPTPEELGLIK